MTLYGIGGSRARLLALVAIGVAAFALAFVVTHTSRSAAGSDGDGLASTLDRHDGGGVPHGLSSVAVLPPLGSKPHPRPGASAVAARITVRRASVVTRPVTSSPLRAISRAPTRARTPARAPVRRSAPKRSQSPGTSFDDSG